MFSYCYAPSHEGAIDKGSTPLLTVVWLNISERTLARYSSNIEYYQNQSFEKISK